MCIMIPSTAQHRVSPLTKWTKRLQWDWKQNKFLISAISIKLICASTLYHEGIWVSRGREPKLKFLDTSGPWYKDKWINSCCDNLYTQGEPWIQSLVRFRVTLNTDVVKKKIPTFGVKKKHSYKVLNPGCLANHHIENCAPLGCYTVSSGNLLPTSQNNVSVPSSGVKNPKESLLSQNGVYTGESVDGEKSQ